MEIQGFAQIKKDATTCKGAKNPNEFIGEVVAVMEFDDDGGILALNPKGTALAMFDKCDVVSSFKCEYKSGVVCPPSDGSEFSNLSYYSKAISRKGGYPPIVGQMVIQNSLDKGEFNDAFLWAKQ